MESFQGSGSLAWRLLATLEGGFIVLLTSALLAYTARNKMKSKKKPSARRVLVTNTTSILGKEIKDKLERRGCSVESACCTQTKLAGSGTGAVRAYDALIVVGADSSPNGLDGLANSISEDVYTNLKMLDNLSPLVQPGGRIVWAGVGGMGSRWTGAADAFDSVLQTSLCNVAKNNGCEAVWIARCTTAVEAANKVVAALICSPESPSNNLRYAAQKVTEYICKWLKIAT